MKTLLHIKRENLLYTMKFIDEKDRRNFLQGVFFTDGKIVATDGIGLVEFSDAYTEEDSANGERFSEILMKNKDVMRFLKNSKSETIDLIEDNTVLFFKDGNNLQFVEVIPAEYPDYKKVIPENNNGGLIGSFKINAERLANFHYGKNDALTITISDNTYTPIIIKSKNAGENMLGVLMLMR